MTNPDTNQPDEADLRDVAALADGSLPGGRRARSRSTRRPARRCSAPSSSASGTRCRRFAGRARRSAPRPRCESGSRPQVPAPVSRDRRRRRPGGAGGRAGRPRDWPAAAAVAIAVGVVALPGTDPTVDRGRRAGRSSLPPSRRPQPEPEQPTLLAASFEGLSYPDWEDEFGWRAVGERSDELDGRATNTVFYENAEGARIAYTIVSGDALDPPADGERSVVEGVELDAFAADGSPAVTWLRDGHTCVLAGDGVEEETLLELAAWKGDGAVAF